MSREKKVAATKLSTGSIRRRGCGGVYTYRCQIKGKRTEISLQTTDYNEALRKAKELVPIVEARSEEVIAAHVREAKGFADPFADLALADAWAKYACHPERAMPRTKSEQLGYAASFADFVAFATRPQSSDERRNHIPHTQVTLLREVTPAVASEYAMHLRSLPYAVYTHNRKIKRIRKIFSVLREYVGHENPFHAGTLMRSVREERATVVRRLAFTREEEQRLLDELRSPARILRNKEEIFVIYSIGMYTGQRLKDCALLQWQNVDMNRRRVYVKQFKTGKEVSIPLAPPLYDALLQAQAWRCDQYVCPKTAARYNRTNAVGKNIGDNLVDTDVLKVIRWIGLKPSVAVPGRKRKMTVYGFHSLRHSFASFCAEAGVPKAVLLSILGTDSAIADKYYTHVGDEAQQKAIAAITGVAETSDPFAVRVQRAIMLLNTIHEPLPEYVCRLKSILQGA